MNPLLIWSVLVALLTPAPAYRSPPAQVKVMRQIGQLSIPAAHVRSLVVEGSMKMYNSPDIFLPELDHGPALYPANSLPWQRGTVIMSGHRITHTHPFRNLGNVRLGEIITVNTRWGIFRYRIVRPPPGTGYVYGGYATTTSPCVLRRACAVFDTLTLNGKPRKAWEFTWHRTTGHRLLLAACTPKGQDQWRLLVFGQLVSVTYGPLTLPAGSLGWRLAVQNGWL